MVSMTGKIKRELKLFGRDVSESYEYLAWWLGLSRRSLSNLLVSVLVGIGAMVGTALILWSSHEQSYRTVTIEESEEGGEKA